MVLKDSTTGKEFASKKEAAEYYTDLGSPFVEGDPILIKFSTARAKEKNNVNALKKLSDEGNEVQ